MRYSYARRRYFLQSALNHIAEMVQHSTVSAEGDQERDSHSTIQRPGHQVLSLKASTVCNE